MNFRKPLMNAAFGVAAILATATSAFADALQIEAPWARATASTASNGAAYLGILNIGASDDRLIGATSDIAERVELHTHKNEGGVMRMTPIDGITIPKNGAVTLKPGGNHIMLMGLKRPLVEGQSFSLKLTFEKADPMSVDVMIGNAGAMGSAMDGMGHGTHGHGHGHGHGMKMNK